MIRSLFSSSSKPAAVRGVQLYLSDHRVIVAALHQSPEGIYFEQSTPYVIDGPPEPERLGIEFQKAFDDFSIQKRDLRGAKRSDWPAYQASGLRSIKEFERAFRPMHCFGLNASNILVRAVMQHPEHEEIELSITFNPLLDPSMVGAKFLELARVAKAISPVAG